MKKYENKIVAGDCLDILPKLLRRLACGNKVHSVKVVGKADEMANRHRSGGVDGNTRYKVAKV